MFLLNYRQTKQLCVSQGVLLHIHLCEGEYVLLLCADPQAITEKQEL